MLNLSSMIARGIGWVFFLTGIGTIAYLMLYEKRIPYEEAATIVFLFAVPLVVLGSAIIVFSKE